MSTDTGENITQNLFAGLCTEHTKVTLGAPKTRVISALKYINYYKIIFKQFHQHCEGVHSINLADRYASKKNERQFIKDAKTPMISSDQCSRRKSYVAQK